MITLLSDFGNKDAYVAIMKGVIAAIAPTEITCDLTHEIAPQNILSARFNLKLAYPHFPSGTVHLAVVDPGVGSSRRALAVRCSSERMSCFLVGPDNGVLSGVIEDFMADSSSGNISAVTLTNPHYWRSGLRDGAPSDTFHGRDIFAPVAAHLANGVPLTALGDRIDPRTLIKTELPPFILNQHNSASDQLNPPNSRGKLGSTAEIARTHQKVLCAGCIQHVDRFGNLISNIPEDVVRDISWQLMLQAPHKRHFISCIKTYSNVPAGELAALVGSHGWIEIACNGASASAALDPWGEITLGTRVEIQVLA